MNHLFAFPCRMVCLLGLSLCFSFSNAQTCGYNDLYGWATKGSGTTGGKGGKVVEVTTMADLKTQASKTGSLIIYVNGQLSGSFSISSNKTVIGLPGAKVGGISISGVSNVIVRNLVIRGSKCNDYEACKAGSDAVSVSNSKNVWIDHLDVADGQDGNLDITKASDFITVSWCKFSYTYDKQHAFSNLNGSADDDTGDRNRLNITFHNNWWADGIQQRQPRVRFGKIHVANNLYTSQKADYLVGVGIEAKVLIEGNIMKATGKPVEFFPGGQAANVLMRNNAGPADANSLTGSGFVPDYVLPVTTPSDEAEALLRRCTGATLQDPRTVSGIETFDIYGTKQAFPNPFTEQLTIELNEGVEAELLTSQGQVLAKISSEVKTLSTSHLPSGFYFLRVQGNEGSRTIKLQKVE